MSIIVQYFAQCDICSYVAVDAWKYSRREVIQLMKTEGWATKGKKDICDKCLSKGEE